MKGRFKFRNFVFVDFFRLKKVQIMAKINFKDNHLSYVSQEADKIPPTLQRMHGERAIGLDLSFNSLTSLVGLSNFTNLEILVLDNNYLDDSVQFPRIPTLHTLSINNNQLTDLSNFILKVKTNVRNLKHLSMLGNPACPSPISHRDKDDDDYQRYRYFILYNIPTLYFLDSKLVSDEERSEGILRGMYMNIAQPKPVQEDISMKSKRKYSPLPLSKLCLSTGGVYGKWTQKYSGKNSEGNRFIKNHEL